MYEQALLDAWHIDPMIVEETWTDEFYNLMINRYIVRIREEANSQERAMNSSKGSSSSEPVIKYSPPVNEYPKDKLASSKES